VLGKRFLKEGGPPNRDYSIFLDRLALLTENGSMKTATPSPALADLEALCLSFGKPQDPELVKRVQERARQYC
jgi:hypothetical protein